jgi:hypothetical protein
VSNFPFLQKRDDLPLAGRFSIEGRVQRSDAVTATGHQPGRTFHVLDAKPERDRHRIPFVRA